jgi:hypothetical protein
MKHRLAAQAIALIEPISVALGAPRATLPLAYQVNEGRSA